MVGNLSVMEMFARLASNSNLQFFKNEEDIIQYFGEDLVKWEDRAFEEKRRYQRLKTAVPLEFSYKDENGETVFFHAVITDLSEGGLYAEYLDLDEASFGKLKLNPSDLRLLNLKIRLPGLAEISVEGEAMRTVIETNQVAIGIVFTKLTEEDKFRILNFLSKG